MIRAALAVPVLAALAVVATGCGTTERAGAVGETLAGHGVVATVERVALDVPIPAGDVTGLGRPAPGARLVGAEVRVCSDTGVSVGPADFTLAVTGGAPTRLRFPQRNYRDGFASLRDSCGEGWVVFEMAADAAVTHVRFGSSGTGTAIRRQDAFDVRFSWSLTV